MAGSIPSSFVREIVDSTEIVSLIDSYLPLKKKGKDHWGICPFCDDGSNPSFSVSEQKQFYYCFKCCNQVFIIVYPHFLLKNKYEFIRTHNSC